ncbi:MAG: hypothetical protein ACK5M3_05005 [Dysgonomonas sp.]
MKKSTIIFILLILFGKVYSQEESMKFELPELGVVQMKIKVELPRIKIQNKSFVKVLMTNIVKEKYGKLGFYILNIKEDKVKGCSTIIVTCHMISDINNNYIGFFYLEDYLFVIKGDNPNKLYSIEREKKYFEYNVAFLSGGLKDIVPIWEPPQWTFIYEKGEVKLLKCEYFN